MSLGYFRGYVPIYEFVSARFENDIASRQCPKKVRWGCVCVCVCDIVRLLGFDVFILLSSAFTLMLYVFEKEKSTISKFIIKDSPFKVEKGLFDLT